MPGLLRRSLRKVGRTILLGIGKLVVRPVRRHLRHFEAMTHEPEAVQNALLHRILQHQVDTAFGKDHHFRSIQSIEEFRGNVPVAGYEGIESYIDRMRQGEFQALVTDPVQMFALTSGTTAARKYIPVTSQYLADYRRSWNIWGLKVFRDHPEVKLRTILQMSGNWNEYQTPAGTPCGAVTGLTARMQKRLIRFLYCIPPTLGEIQDAQAKYYLALRLSVPRQVGMVIAANPSTLINLARMGNEYRESLIRDIHDGTLTSPVPIPDEIRSALQGKIQKKDPQRARELDAIVEKTGTLYPKDYWKCFLLGNWTGGSMGVYLRHYPEYFGEAPVRDIGLIASEGRMTIPFDNDDPSGVLDISSHFFEFIPEEEVDSLAPTVLQAHEVQEGRNYYILPTTSYGLYRYQIFDLVKVTRFFNNTPCVQFLSKGSHFANLTGEKLSEYHVTTAMQDVLHDLSLKVGTYSLAPSWPKQESAPHYSLFLEDDELMNDDQRIKLAYLLDERLKELNIEYEAKRKSLRLGSIGIQLIASGAWQEWDRKRLANCGGALDQYKHPCLLNDLNLSETLQIRRSLRQEEVIGTAAGTD